MQTQIKWTILAQQTQIPIEIKQSTQILIHHNVDKVDNSGTEIANKPQKIETKQRDSRRATKNVDKTQVQRACHKKRRQSRL